MNRIESAHPYKISPPLAVQAERQPSLDQQSFFGEDDYQQDHFTLQGSVVSIDSESEKTMKMWSKNWAIEICSLSPEQKDSLIQESIAETNAQQEIVNKRVGTSQCPIYRGFQAKSVFATKDAVLRVSANLPPNLQIGPFQAGKELAIVVRLSNASPIWQPDALSDQRGMALRISGTQGEYQDMMFTSGSGTNHARNAKEFVASIRGSRRREQYGSLVALAGLAKDVGLVNALKIFARSMKAKNKDRSLAATSFYSRAPFQWGDYAVKMRIVPKETEDEALLSQNKDDQLKEDFLERVKQGDVTYTLQIQGYRNPGLTSIRNHSKKWDSPWISVAQITFVQRENLSLADVLGQTADISNQMVFSPFNQWDGEDGSVLTPLGELNMLRKEIYRASAEKRMTP